MNNKFYKPQDLYDDISIHDTNARAKHNYMIGFSKNDWNTDPKVPLHQKTSGFRTTYDDNFSQYDSKNATEVFYETRTQSLRNEEVDGGDHLTTGKGGITFGMSGVNQHQRDLLPSDVIPISDTGYTYDTQVGRRRRFKEAMRGRESAENIFGVSSSRGYAGAMPAPLATERGAREAVDMFKEKNGAVSKQDKKLIDDIEKVKHQVDKIEKKEDKKIEKQHDIEHKITNKIDHNKSTDKLDAKLEKNSRKLNKLEEERDAKIKQIQQKRNKLFNLY